MSKSPIGRKLALSFAVVAALAAVQCLVHVLLIGNVAGAVGEMTHDEKRIRAGLDLATALREQYIHAAHNIAQGDRSHLDHYGEWVERVEKGVARMATMVPDDEKPRLERIAEASRDFDRTFRNEILGAVERGDVQTMRRAHARIEAVLGMAAHEADSLARRFEQRMSHAHVSTTETTHLGIGLAAAGILLIVLVAIYSTIQIRLAVVAPLARLTDAAEQIGRGTFSGGAEEAGQGEFKELGQAFDRMSTELHKREAQLVQSERMAAIGQLAAGIAHEINNPIGVIRGYLRTMLPEAREESLREELRILDEEAAACQRIAEDLLAYARTPELELSDVAIEGLLEEVARRFASAGSASEVRIEVAAAPGVLRADALRLRQVVANLVNNAIQAGSPEVTVVGECSATSYMIRVLDRGSGIAPEQRERIFEPFYSGRRGGTGLGLAVCLGIVKAHGGTIEAQPRANGGTELIVTLPTGAASTEV
jgi:two-component system NtrC family sensor kinase